MGRIGNRVSWGRVVLEGKGEELKTKEDLKDKYFGSRDDTDTVPLANNGIND